MIPTKLADEHLNKIPIDANMKEIDYYTDARIKQFARDYAVLLARHFKNVIDACYNHSFDLYKRRRLDYAKLLEEAKKKNFRNLDTELLSKLKKLRKEFTSRFALPKQLKLSVYDKETKKMARVPLKALKWHVSKHFRSLFKIKQHGRDKYSGWQFKDYYTVDYMRIDELKKLSGEKKEDTTMTKAEKQELLDKEARGELAMPAKYLIKQQERKERSQKRRQETIAKKAVQASFEEFAKLKAENEQLKAEIARLKQLKDLNSDIDDMPEEDAPSEEELLEKQAEELAAQVQIPEDDIPEELPEPAPVQPPSDDIPEEEQPHPSKVYSRLAEFVKKCYIGPSTAARLSEMYGERQEFKQPVVHCDLVAALQSNAKQRLTVLSTAFKELNGKLLKKDLAWLVSSINKTKNEISLL